MLLAEANFYFKGGFNVTLITEGLGLGQLPGIIQLVLFEVFPTRYNI